MNQVVEDCLRYFTRQLTAWQSTISHIHLSYIAVPDDVKLRLLVARVVMGTELDVLDETFMQRSFRNRLIVAGRFVVNKKISPGQIIDWALEGSIKTANGEKLTLLSTEQGPQSASINYGAVDASEGSQLYSMIYLDGVNSQNLRNTPYDPNRVIESLQTSASPFEDMRDFATYFGVDNQQFDRGSSIALLVASPARFSPDTRLQDNEAFIKFSVGRLVKPTGLRLSYILKQRKGSSDRKDISLADKHSVRRKDGVRTFELTIPVEEPVSLRLYLSYEDQKIGELYLQPTNRPSTVAGAVKSRQPGRAFQSAFETYVASGATREGACGFVVPVLDEDNERWAIKYLKPEHAGSCIGA